MAAESSVRDLQDLINYARAAGAKDLDEAVEWAVWAEQANGKGPSRRVSQLLDIDRRARIEK
jgi:hypothetical protein